MPGTPLPRWFLLAGLLLAGMPAHPQKIAAATGKRPMVAVPQVVGLSLEAGVRELGKARLRASTWRIPLEGTFPDHGRPWKVTGQQPRAGSQAKEGTVVELETNLPRSVVVPQVVGLTVSDAGKLLKQRFLFGALGDFGRQDARVLRQSRPAGTQVPPFETVTYYAQPPILSR